MLRKLDLYACSTQKCIYLDDILMKLNVCIFFIKEEKVFDKYNEICEKVSNDIKKEFDGKPVHNEKYLKTKIKSYIGKFHKIFTIIKYQKKTLNVFVYQKY